MDIGAASACTSQVLPNPPLSVRRPWCRPSGGGCATSRRDAALPKNEVRTRRLKTRLSALEHGKEWRAVLLL
jgi:hypothetical protein